MQELEGFEMGSRGERKGARPGQEIQALRIKSTPEGSRLWALAEFSFIPMSRTVN